ncbi:MAG: hypothetical protein IJU81_03370 [Bacteroidales bacterium]|nr:hypothetical protein [Bacteroidales bacterium]
MMRRLLCAMLFVATTCITFLSCSDIKECYIVVSSNNPAWGVATGGGNYHIGDTVELRAVPIDDRYKFVEWNDGSTDKIHYVKATEDATYIAYFDLRKDSIRRVRVSFDGNTWDAAVQDLQYSNTTSTPSWRCIACQNPRQSNGSFTYPMVTAIFYDTTTGTHNYQFDTRSGGYLGGLMRLEYTRDHYFSYGGTYRGDFWAYNCSLKINKIKTIDDKRFLWATIEASMADVYSWMYIPNTPLDTNHRLRITIDSIELEKATRGL